MWLQDIYIVKPLSTKNTSKNAKGKLADKWRNTQHRLRVSGVISGKEQIEKENELQFVELDGNILYAIIVLLCKSFESLGYLLFIDELKAHIKWLEKNRKTWDQVKLHWKFTHEYRVPTLASNSFDEILTKEWPILNTDLGPQLVSICYQAIQTKNFKCTY